MREGESFFRRDEFMVGYEVQTGWGFPIALDFFFSGTGAALFLFSLIFHSPAGIILGLIFLVIGVLLLFFDLGAPWRVWKAFSKLKTSWISRGTLFITITVLFGIFDALAGFPEVPWWVLIVFGAIAVMVVLYPGMVISYSPSMAAWNHPLTPILFGLHSLTSALSILFVIDAYSDGELGGMIWIQLILFVFLLVGMIIFVLVSKASTSGARESVRLLSKGKERFFFLFMGIFVGIILPMALLLAMPGAASPLGWVVAACILRLVGDLGFRHSILKVGLYEPVI